MFSASCWDQGMFNDSFFCLFVHLFFDVSFTNLLSVKTRKTVSTFMLTSFLMSYWFSMGNSVSVTHGSYRVSVLSVFSNSRLTNRTATLQPCIFVTQAYDWLDELLSSWSILWLSYWLILCCFSFFLSDPYISHPTGTCRAYFQVGGVHRPWHEINWTACTGAKKLSCWV